MYWHGRDDAEKVKYFIKSAKRNGEFDMSFLLEEEVASFNQPGIVR